MKQLTAIIAAVCLLASCKVNYDKSPSGLVYKIFPGKGGDKLVAGKFIKFYISYIIPEKKDSVLYTNFGQIPGYDPVDTSAKPSPQFYREVVPKMSVGDSAEIIISVDTLKNRKFLPDFNEIFVKGSHIKCTMKIVGVYNNQNDLMADLNKEKEMEQQREIKSLEDYIAKKGIKAIKTKNGVFVSIDVPGDTSIKADSGKTALVMYRGYLQTTGKVFDTNMDTSKGRTEAYPVNVGQGGVIPGWDEAFPYFGKGAKGKILVPAMLAYGDRSPGPEVPPYSNLIFDVEFKDITVTPPPPALTDEQKMQMLQQQMQQQQEQGGH